MDNKGSLGGQISPKNGHEIIEKPPFQNVTQVMHGIAASNSNRLSGEFVTQLMAANFSQLTSDNDLKNKEIKELREKIERTLEELNEWKLQSRVLKERLESNGKLSTLRNLAITFGSALVGIGIELYRNNLTHQSHLVSVIGIGLILFSWFGCIGGENASK